METGEERRGNTREMPTTAVEIGPIIGGPLRSYCLIICSHRVLKHALKTDKSP